MSIYKGEHVSLQIINGDFHIRMKDGAISDTLVLTSTEGAQLMTFFMETFGIEIDYEEDDEVPEGKTLQ